MIPPSDRVLIKIGGESYKQSLDTNQESFLFMLKMIANSGTNYHKFIGIYEKSLYGFCRNEFHQEIKYSLEQTMQ